MFTQSKIIMLRVCLLVGLAIGASGCSIFSENADKVAKAGGRLVTFYCDNITVPEIREEIRAKVNAYAAPNAVAVTCANGGPALNTAVTP